MAYTKHDPIKQRPDYVDTEVDLTYHDFNKAVNNRASYIEHGIDDIKETIETIFADAKQSHL